MNGVTGDRAAYGTFRRSDQITITSRNFLWNCRSGLSSCSPILEISWSIALSGVERRLSPPSARDGDTLESTLYRDLLILPGATLRRNFSACTPRRIRACARLHARTDGRRTIRGQDDGSLNGSVSRGDRPDVGLLSYVDLRTCLPIRSMRVLAFSVSARSLPPSAAIPALHALDALAEASTPFDQWETDEELAWTLHDDGDCFQVIVNTLAVMHRTWRARCGIATPPLRSTLWRRRRSMCWRASGNFCWTRARSPCPATVTCCSPMSPHQDGR